MTTNPLSVVQNAMIYSNTSKGRTTAEINDVDFSLVVECAAPYRVHSVGGAWLRRFGFCKAAVQGRSLGVCFGPETDINVIDAMLSQVATGSVGNEIWNKVKLYRKTGDEERMLLRACRCVHTDEDQLGGPRAQIFMCSSAASSSDVSPPRSLHRGIPTATVLSDTVLEDSKMPAPLRMHEFVLAGLTSKHTRSSSRISELRTSGEEAPETPAPSMKRGGSSEFLSSLGGGAGIALKATVKALRSYKQRQKEPAGAETCADAVFNSSNSSNASAGASPRSPCPTCPDPNSDPMHLQLKELQQLALSSLRFDEERIGTQAVATADLASQARSYGPPSSYAYSQSRDTEEMQAEVADRLAAAQAKQRELDASTHAAVKPAAAEEQILALQRLVHAHSSISGEVAW